MTRRLFRVTASGGHHGEETVIGDRLERSEAVSRAQDAIDADAATLAVPVTLDAVDDLAQDVTLQKVTILLSAAAAKADDVVERVWRQWTYRIEPIGATGRPADRQAVPRTETD